jgi:hypothetical protein
MQATLTLGISSALTAVCYLQVQWFRLMQKVVSYATGRPTSHHEKETLIKYQEK